MNFKPTIKPLRPGDPINIDMKNAVPMECPCGSKFFMSVFQAFRVSALASPTGQEMVLQTPVLVCMKCEAQLDLKEGIGK